MYIFFYLLTFTFMANLHSQIPLNIQYNRTLDRCVRYEATLLQQNNILYVDAKGGIEEYQILPDGSLELISYLSTYFNNPANAIILGDTLFVATQIENNSVIYIIDISVSPMMLINTLNTNSQESISIMQGNQNHFMYLIDGDYSLVYERSAMQYVTQLFTGFRYAVRDNYLFSYRVSNNFMRLVIYDIQNVADPIEISSISIGNNDINYGYFFYEDLLFITQGYHVVIINIADIFNPVVISSIDNLPLAPAGNSIQSLIIYENYLMFGNKQTKFWIYDISDLSFPQFLTVDTQFVSVTSNKNSLMLHEDRIYYSRNDRNIIVMNANELPNLNIINQYGNHGQFQFSEFVYPFILYSNPVQKKQYYLNINDTEPEPALLAESPYGWVSQISFNDSIICFITAEFDFDKLVICSYNNEDIMIENIIALNSSNYNGVFIRGEHIILCGYLPGELSINLLNPDYSLNEVGYFIVGRDPYLIDQNDQCNSDYLFVRSFYNGIRIIDVFENQIPFDFVSSFEIISNNHQFDIFYFLENDKTLLCDFYFPGALYYLCDYIFPNTFVFLDSYITSDAYLKMNEDYLFWFKDYDGSARFYTWQNNEIELTQNYEFDVEINNVFFSYEQSKFFAVGRHNIQEYSCDFVSTINHQIPLNKPHLSNHPNPFNPSTTISFSLTTEITEDTELVIFNIKGQKVKILDCSNSFAANTRDSCSHYSLTWDGTDQNNQRVSTGVYLYQLQVEGKPVASRKMMMLK